MNDPKLRQKFAKKLEQLPNEQLSLVSDFHKDPADIIIVATARIYNVPFRTYAP